MIFGHICNEHYESLDSDSKRALIFVFSSLSAQAKFEATMADRRDNHSKGGPFPEYGDAGAAYTLEACKTGEGLWTPYVICGFTQFVLKAGQPLKDARSALMESLQMLSTVSLHRGLVHTSENFSGVEHMPVFADIYGQYIGQGMLKERRRNPNYISTVFTDVGVGAVFTLCAMRGEKEEKWTGAIYCGATATIVKTVGYDFNDASSALKACQETAVKILAKDALEVIL